MNEVINMHNQNIDNEMQLVDAEIERRNSVHAAEIALKLGKVAMDFARVERKPRYDPESRESDVEHSYMLQLIAVEMTETFFPELDSGLVAKFSGVHDMPELIAGDVPTFHVNDEMLRDKHHNEQVAIEKLKDILPPHTYALLLRYEEQIEPEARLVRFIDKYCPLVVDIHGPGLMVLKQDYNVTELAEYLTADQEQSERYKKMFPEKHFDFIHDGREILSKMFAKEFI